MTQLSGMVGYSVRELESALEQLEHMGYVRREFFEQACSPSCEINRGSGHCEECGFLSSKAFRFWVLTEKGQIMVGQTSVNDVK